MSRKGMLALLVVAVALGAGALVLLTRPPALRSTFGPVVVVEPSRLLEVRVETTGTDDARRLVRSGRGWIIEDARGGWPVDESRLAAGLEILGAAQGERRKELDPEFVARARVTLVQADAPGGSGTIETVIEIPQRMMAGRASLRVRDASGTWMVEADSTIPMLFLAREGADPLASWRDARLIHGMGPDVAGLALASGRERVVLTRVGDRWGVIEPVVAPASPHAVERLLGTLAALSVASFDVPSALERAEMGLAGGEGESIEVEFSRRESGATGEVARRTERCLLRLGARSDLAGASRFVEHVTTDGGVERSRVLMASDSILGRVDARAESYVSGRTLALARADVTGLAPVAAGEVPAAAPELRPTIVRTRDRWSARGEDAPPAPLGEKEAAGVEDLLLELCETDATTVRRKRPESMVPIARLVVFTGGEGAPSPTAEVEVGVAREPSPEGGGITDRWVMATRVGAVYRLYPAGAGAKGTEWLREAAPKPGVEPPPEPEDDPN